MNNVAISEDASLEREADQIGAKASVGGSSGRVPQANSPGPMPGHPVAQRKKVPNTVGKDDFGQFETTTFKEIEGRGVEIELKFHPHESKCDAKKIAFTQAVKQTDGGGNAVAIDPNTASKMVGSGKTGAGFHVDQLSDLDSPLYATDVSLGAGKDLKDTPLNSQIGYCYKAKPDDAKKLKRDAVLGDKPKLAKKKGVSATFETAALAIDGTDAGKYYGSVTWGYKMEGTDAAPTVTKSDIALGSKGTPTSNFIEAAKVWNVGKTRGTVQVTASPDATVLKADTMTTEKLAKDKKLKQLDTVAWGEDAAIKAEVLKDDGTGSGKIVYIKVTDCKDAGDGSAVKKLPTS